MRSLDARAACPCGRREAGNAANARAYGACCGRWLESTSQSDAPTDAESLMRSRYSAFVLEREGYLLKSWAASHRPPSIVFDAEVKWLGLEVRAHRQTGEDSAEVEFVARQKPTYGPAVRLHERSRFVREDGNWLYLDGEIC